TSTTLGGATGLPDGPHTFSVKARDQAGNEDASPDERSFTVDTTLPAPVIDSPREGRRVMDSFIVSGTAEAGSTVKLFEGPNGKGRATADTSGNWSILLAGVAEGSHTYTARATDEAGNTSETPDGRTVIVDITAPTVEEEVPHKNATGVDPGADIEAFFSEAMKASTINEGTVKLYQTGSATLIDAVIGYDAAEEKAILDPVDPLVQGKRYKAVVTTRAKDEAGNRLDQNPSRTDLQPKTWFFTVGTS
ncbi:MAG: Ig-like domain-containing protein, partial [Rubrobacter sp.]